MQVSNCNVSTSKIWVGRGATISRQESEAMRTKQNEAKRCEHSKMKCCELKRNETKQNEVDYVGLHLYVALVAMCEGCKSSGSSLLAESPPGILLGYLEADLKEQRCNLP